MARLVYFDSNGTDFQNIDLILAIQISIKQLYRHDIDIDHCRYNSICSFGMRWVLSRDVGCTRVGQIGPNWFTKATVVTLWMESV